jgi:prokaryotic ubiquitin-like protein Pup
MPTQVTKPRPTPREMDELAATDAAAQDHVTVAEIDDYLDEIDEVLETNANEVLLRYVQKGGQAVLVAPRRGGSRAFLAEDLLAGHGILWLLLVILAVLAIVYLIKRVF